MTLTSNTIVSSLFYPRLPNTGVWTNLGTFLNVRLMTFHFNSFRCSEGIDIQYCRVHVRSLMFAFYSFSLIPPYYPFLIYFEYLLHNVILLCQNGTSLIVQLWLGFTKKVILPFEHCNPKSLQLSLLCHFKNFKLNTKQKMLSFHWLLHQASSDCFKRSPFHCTLPQCVKFEMRATR